jgi:hypothetical protein
MDEFFEHIELYLADRSTGEDVRLELKNISLKDIYEWVDANEWQYEFIGWCEV